MRWGHGVVVNAAERKQLMAIVAQHSVVVERPSAMEPFDWVGLLRLNRKSVAVTTKY